MAQEEQGHQKRQFRNFKLDIQDMDEMEATELLTVDVHKHIKKLEELINEYTTNSEIIHELMEMLSDTTIDSALEVIDTDLRAFAKLQRQYNRLVKISESYNYSIQMKTNVYCLNDTEVLVGPAEQEDIKALRDYLVSVVPTLTLIACTDVKVIYNEVEKLSTDILKRSAQQLLSSRVSSSDTEKSKPTPSLASRPSTITLKFPSFHSNFLKWKDFLPLVASRLDKEPGLTNADKSCLLVEAMADDKARQHAEAAIAHTTTYKETVKILKRIYEDNRLLFCHHYNDLHQPDTFKDTVEDLDCLEDRLNTGVRGLESSISYFASQLLVAALERISPGLSRQWKQYSHELQDPFPVEKLLAFVERQRKSAPDSRLTSLKMEKQNRSKGQPTTRKSAFQLQESVKNSEAHKVKCQYCNEDQSIFMCSSFKALSLHEKLDKIRSKHL